MPYQIERRVSKSSLFFLSREKHFPKKQRQKTPRGAGEEFLRGRNFSNCIFAFISMSAIGLISFLFPGIRRDRSERSRILPGGRKTQYVPAFWRDRSQH
jgi:hypothetical protein